MFFKAYPDLSGSQHCWRPTLFCTIGLDAAHPWLQADRAMLSWPRKCFAKGLHWPGKWTCFEEDEDKEDEEDEEDEEHEEDEDDDDDDDCDCDSETDHNDPIFFWLQ